MPPFNSFSADTRVVTKDGDNPISEVEEGDLVLAWNEETGETGYYTVTDTIAHLDHGFLYVTIDDERIETTWEHPFYVEGKGWVKAGELQSGDRVRRADGSSGAVEAVEIVSRPQVMYNLSVAEAHTFFVGDGQWLVHNCGGKIAGTNGLGHSFDSHAHPWFGRPDIVVGCRDSETY